MRLLRGRVALRPIIETHVGSIIIPATYADWNRKEQHRQGLSAKSSHEGIVLGMGPPAMVYNKHELPHGFNVGDRVNFSYQMNEKWSDSQRWEDGEACIFISQECINGVIE